MPSLGTNFFSYLLKTLAVVNGLVAIICSIEAGKGCDFLKVEDTDGDMLDLIRNGERPAFVFGTATRMRVGIFQYEVLEGSNVQGCVDYPDNFFNMDGYPSITAAQFCSIFSPLFCAIGIICTLIEFCVCTYRGSTLCGGLFFLLAMAIQCGVFGIISDPVFCFEDSELECSIGTEMYLAITAVVFYFLAACFACCAPHSDPCYKNAIRKKDDPTGGDDGLVHGETATTQTTTTKRATVVLNSNQSYATPTNDHSPDAKPGGRRKSRPSVKTGQDINSKYDEHGNRLFN